MAKILVFSTHILWESHYETELEIMQRHLDDGDEVIQLMSNGELDFCDTNPTHNFPKIIQNIAKRKHGLTLLSQDIQSITYKLLNQEDSKAIASFRWEAKNIEELKTIDFKNFDIGYAVASSLISLLSNPNPSIKENRVLIDRMMHTALEVYFSVINQLKKRQPDVLYIFNGRLANPKAAFRAAESVGITCKIHERGSTFKHYELYENHLPHDLAKMGDKIRKFWAANADVKHKKERAAYFYENRRKGKVLSWKSFTENQQKGLLPEGFDSSKKNIMIFNSSEFEFAAIGPEWKIPQYSNQNEGIMKILSSMKDRLDYHFYIRLHPNLARANPENYRALLELPFSNYTLIMPEDKIDSYHLLDNAYKVITFGSTMGIEATYWRKISIMAGHSLYESLDAVYRPQTHEELISLLVQEGLEPKNQEGAEIYGYYFTESGIPYK
ncbi:MAG: hypothetical protein LC109_00005, partial [Bacteroidia bacterium]|nr:hypothetical protein [Bacteroidia bacterium]